MNFVRGPTTITESARMAGSLNGVVVVRCGKESVTSNPQYQASAPSTRSAGSVLEPLSMVARSPGYCRTTIGAAVVPVRWLTKGPTYTPPRSQIVSPGLAGLVLDKAVARS